MIRLFDELFIIIQLNYFLDILQSMINKYFYITLFFLFL